MSNDALATNMRTVIAKALGWKQVHNHAGLLYGWMPQSHLCPEAEVSSVPYWNIDLTACFNDLMPELIKKYKNLQIHIHTNGEYISLISNNKLIIPPRKYKRASTVCGILCEAFLHIKER